MRTATSVVRYFTRGFLFQHELAHLQTARSFLGIAPVEPSRNWLAGHIRSARSNAEVRASIRRWIREERAK